MVCRVTEEAEILTYSTNILKWNNNIICLVCNVTEGQNANILKWNNNTNMPEGAEILTNIALTISGTTILICLVCRVTEGGRDTNMALTFFSGTTILAIPGLMLQKGRDTNQQALTSLSGTTILICLVCNVTEGAEILTMALTILSGTTILICLRADTEALTFLSGTTILVEQKITILSTNILYNTNMPDTANTTINATKTQDDHMSWLKTTLYVVIGCTVSVVFFISVIVVAVFRIRMKRNTQCRTYGSERSGRGQRDSGHDPVNYQAEDPFLNMAPSANYGNIIVNVNNGIQYVPGAEFAEFTAIMEAPPSYSDVEQEIFDTQNISPPDYSTIDRNPLRVNSVINVTPTRNQRPNSGQTPVNRRDRSNQPVDSRPRTQNAAVQTLTHRSHGRPQSGTDSLPRQPTINVQGGQILLTNISDNSQPTQVSDNEQVSSERPSSALLQVQNGQIMFGNLNTTDQSASTDIESSVPVDESQDNNPRTNIQVCEGQIVLASENTPAVITENPTVNESPSRRHNHRWYLLQYSDAPLNSNHRWYLLQYSDAPLNSNHRWYLLQYSDAPLNSNHRWYLLQYSDAPLNSNHRWYLLQYSDAPLNSNHRWYLLQYSDAPLNSNHRWYLLQYSDAPLNSNHRWYLLQYSDDPLNSNHRWYLLQYSDAPLNSNHRWYLLQYSDAPLNSNHRWYLLQYSDDPLNSNHRWYLLQYSDDPLNSNHRWYLF
ncbi:unnamed protein product [Mytilus edulis]|uniref:Uncharacterized protein n=1 Tax=Mytilus edulis TaxID=6550 RepID=A0A8S3RM44_MYTED|nr:unnamed protein product [Mytilus edulis]